jgi:uncharacterized membrane protein
METADKRRRLRVAMVARLFTLCLFIYGAFLQFSEGRTALGIGLIVLIAVVLVDTWDMCNRKQAELNSNPKH